MSSAVSAQPQASPEPTDDRPPTLDWAACWPGLNDPPGRVHHHLRQLPLNHPWRSALLRLSMATRVRRGTPVIEPTLLVTASRPAGFLDRGERLDSLSPGTLIGAQFRVADSDLTLLQASAAYGGQSGLTSTLLALTLPPLPRSVPSRLGELNPPVDDLPQTSAPVMARHLQAAQATLQAQGNLHAAQACANLAAILIRSGAPD